MQVEVDFAALAQEMVRQLRGDQSTRAASKRLGYRSNVVLRWEDGSRPPPADDVLRLAHLQGRNVRGACIAVTEVAARALNDLSPRDATFVPTLVRVLVASTTRQKAAELSGLSTDQIGRAVRGESRLRLPVLLALIHHVGFALVEFIRRICDVTELPAARLLLQQHTRLESLRIQTPLYWAVFVALEGSAYRALPAHDDAWVAERLALDIEVVSSVIEMGRTFGWIQPDEDLLEFRGPDSSVRFAMDAAEARRVSAFYAREAARRTPLHLATSRWQTYQTTDAALLEAAHVISTGFDEARQILAANRGERVGYAMAQFVSLDGTGFGIRQVDNDE